MHGLVNVLDIPSGPFIKPMLVFASPRHTSGTTCLRKYCGQQHYEGKQRAIMRRTSGFHVGERHGSGEVERWRDVPHRRDYDVELSFSR